MATQTFRRGLNVTVRDRKTREAVDALVGKPVPFFQRFKKGGIGTRRMVVLELSQGLLQLQDRDGVLLNASIERRPNGILVHVNRQLQHFAWVIPYQDLKVVFAETCDIKAQGEHMRLGKGVKANRHFLRELTKTLATAKA